MLILLSTVQANKVDDNLYTGITLDDNALHSSKGIIEYSINKLITRQMLLDMLKLQKKAWTLFFRGIFSRGRYGGKPPLEGVGRNEVRPRGRLSPRGG